MRELTGHQVNPVNDKLTVQAMDPPDHTNAHHLYWVTGFDPVPSEEKLRTVQLYFQNGPIAESGVNGLTHEVLLAILIDRLECFQSGPYACVENAEALAGVRAAQAALHRRTLDRMARGVEGTHTP